MLLREGVGSFSWGAWRGSGTGLAVCRGTCMPGLRAALCRGGRKADKTVWSTWHPLWAAEELPTASPAPGYQRREGKRPRAPAERLRKAARPG